ncbi:hypothetical protein D3C73_1338180 [compost metagenome]
MKCNSDDRAFKNCVINCSDSKQQRRNDCACVTENASGEQGYRKSVFYRTLTDNVVYQSVEQNRQSNANHCTTSSNCLRYSHANIKIEQSTEHRPRCHCQTPTARSRGERNYMPRIVFCRLLGQHSRVIMITHLYLADIRHYSIPY